MSFSVEYYLILSVKVGVLYEGVVFFVFLIILVSFLGVRFLKSGLILKLIFFFVFLDEDCVFWIRFLIMLGLFVEVFLFSLIVMVGFGVGLLCIGIVIVLVILRRERVRMSLV